MSNATPQSIQPTTEDDVPAVWLDGALKYLARELLADPKTYWIGERDPKKHICWTAAERLASLKARVEELETGEKALRDEIWHLRGVVTDVRIMANAGNFKKFEGEPWLARARNIDLHHDPVATDIAFRAALPSSGEAER